MSKELVPVPQENFRRLVNQFGDYIESRVPDDRETKPLRRMSPTYVDPSTVDADIVHNLLSNSDAGDARQLLALYDQIIWSDNHMQGEVGKRKLAVLGDPLAIVAKDKKHPDDVRAAALAQEQIDDCPTFLDGCSHLLDSCIWPVTLCEKIYRRSARPGLKYDISELVPLPHFVLYLDPTGPLRVFDVGEDGTVYGTHHMCDPMRYITYRGHLLGDRDHRGGPMRSLVFWWLFGAFNRDWWIRFMDRFGTPFPIGKYEQGDDEARAILMGAFSLASRMGGLVISKDTDVELNEINTQNAAEAYKTFHDVAQKEKSKLIVGQTTSASSDSAGGLGSGIGKAQSEVRDDIRRMDQIRFARAIKDQLIVPFLRINRIPGRVAVTIGAEDTEDTDQTATALSNLHNAGVELADEGIRIFGDRMGLPLQRIAIAAPAPDRPPSGRSPLTTLSAAVPGSAHHLAADDANSRIARAAAADLARAFGTDLAPLREVILASTDAGDLEHRLTAHLRTKFPGFRPHHAAPIIEAALTSFLGNGV